ncbi:hypothetical protein B0H10DRAFT_767260 [Mycena sp. CBHHK59/15]|nr:hypothetical protein B0H10DRAFT_767260 [Mycena sp. CBHHK59/15]
MSMSLPPLKPSSLTRRSRLRRKPKYTDLNMPTSIQRCTSARSNRNPSQYLSLALASEEESDRQRRNTTPSVVPAVLNHSLPPRATSTTLSRQPSSTARAISSIGDLMMGVEPLCIVKRVSRLVASESAHSSPRNAGSVMDELLLWLDGVYAELWNAASPEAFSCSDSGEDGSEEWDGADADEDDSEDAGESDDEDDESGWRTTYYSMESASVAPRGPRAPTPFPF